MVGGLVVALVVGGWVVEGLVVALVVGGCVVGGLVVVVGRVDNPRSRASMNIWAFSFIVGWPKNT